MIKITLEHLQQICEAPESAARFIDPLNTHMNNSLFAVNTPQRICMFLGQIALESARFSRTLEIASGKEYEGRAALGNVNPGDGPRYKGRGLIQITGRNNYREMSIFMYKNSVMLLNNPELLEQPANAVISALYYWKVNGLNAICDVSEDHEWHVRVNEEEKVFDTYQWLTEKINGGQNDYDKRLQFFNRAKEIFYPRVVQSPGTLSDALIQEMNTDVVPPM